MSDRRQPWLNVKQGSDEWLEARKTTDATGTVTTTVCGHGYMSLKRLLAERRGEVKPKEFNDFVQSMLDYGREHEPVALRNFMERYVTDEGAKMHETGMWVRTLPSGMRLGGSPDGLLELSDGTLIGVELKCPTFQTMDRSFPARYKYLIQIFHYMFVIGLDRYVLYNWAPDGDSAYYVEFDAAIWEEIEKRLELFRKLVADPSDKRRPSKLLMPFHIRELLWIDATGIKTGDEYTVDG